MTHLQDQFRRLQPLFGLVAGAVILLTSVINSLSAYGVNDPDRQVGSSDEYIAPPLDDQARLDDIHQEFGSAVQELRLRELEASGSFAAALVLDPQLALQAQALAESNAVEGLEGTLDRNLSVIQLNLPVEEANAHAFVQQIVTSEPHTAVLVDPNVAFYGIGLAQGHNRVWLTLVMSA